jgi:hypothetical protein
VGEDETELVMAEIDAMSELGAVNISCNWKDNRGGYVVTVDFGDNHTCEAVDANRVKAYKDAHNAAIVKKASMP